MTKLDKVSVVKLTTTPEVEAYMNEVDAEIMNISDTKAEINPCKQETPQPNDRVTP